MIKRKVAFVTGASSEIGVAVAREYLLNGWNVIAHCRDMSKDLELLLSINGSSMQILKVDFLDKDIEMKFANLLETNQTLQNCDALINLAALLNPIDFANLSIREMQRHLQVNALVPAILIQKITPFMEARGWGRVVNISSVGVKFGGGKDTFAYSLSKHALEFLTTRYRNLASKNVLVNSLRIGIVQTRLHEKIKDKDISKRIDLIPMKRAATPEEIGKVIFDFGSEKNTYTTGQIITISGGE